MKSQKTRLLIIKLSSLGDIFHALPAVNNLQVELEAEVDWVTQPEYVELVESFQSVSEVIAFPRRNFWRGLGALVRALRAKHYDYVIDLQGLIKSALVARLARGGRVIGPSFQREAAWLFYDAIAGRRNKGRHSVEENLDVVRFLGLPEMPVMFPVKFPVPVQAPTTPAVAMIPFSRRPNKNWPVSSFVELARLIQEECGAAIYLFGGREDRAGCEAIRAALSATAGVGGIFNLAGQTTLVEMGGWFSRMKLVVANDSGPLHMAVALGIPVVTFFGPTDPGRTGPYGAGHHVLRSGVDCSPCFSKQCRLARVECMVQITPQQVMNAVREIWRNVKMDGTP